MKLGVWEDISFQQMKSGCLVGCVLHFAPRQIGYENMYFPWMLHIMGFFCLVRCFCVCVLFVLNLFLNSFQKINKCPLHFFMVEELTWSQCPIHTPLNYRMSWSVLRNTKPLHHGVMMTPLGVVRLPRTKYSKFLWSPLIRITQNQ